MFDYGVGGNIRERDLSEGFADIPMNRTLLVQRLTNDPQAAPTITKGLDTVDKVFEHYQPNVDVEFEDKEGNTQEENLKFNTVGDFGPKGILKQSKYLSDIQDEKNELFRFMKQIKSNKVLKKILENPASKAAYVAEMKKMLKELDDAK